MQTANTINVPTRPLSMRGLRTFCAAARHESFRLAADELFVTPSAVSHQVRKLENELQVELFERRGRNIALTAAGRMLFQEAWPGIQHIDSVVRTLRKENIATTLRVSVQPFFATELFVPRLSEFTATHPNIGIQIESTDGTTARHPATADLSIRLFREPPAGLSAKRLFELSLVPACSPAFRDSLNIVGWHLARAITILTHSSRPDAWKTWSEHAGMQVPRTANLIQLDSMTALMRAAEQSVGAALVPLPLSSPLFESGRLVRLFDYELHTRDAYYIVARPDDIRRPEVQALRDWTLQAFAQPG